MKSEFVETDTSELIPDEKDDPVYIPLDVEPENHKELSEVIVDSDTKAPEFDIQEIPPVDKNTPVFVMFVTPRAVTEDPEKFRKASLDTVVTEAVIIDPEEAGIEEPNVVSEFIAIKLLEDGNKENEFVPTLAEAELPVDGDDVPKFTPKDAVKENPAELNAATVYTILVTVDAISELVKLVPEGEAIEVPWEVE